ATFDADGQVETLTEATSGGKPSKRHDDLDHRWTITSPGGVQTLSIVADVNDGGDLDSGIALEWSQDGSSWVTLGTLVGSVDDSYLLGSPTGTIWVRVIDTNSTPGEFGYDSISVDLLRVDGEEPGDPTTAVLSAMSVTEVSAGRGEAFGQVAVTVENELGQPVVGAEVSLTFDGAFSDVATVTTDGSGRATYTTATSARKPAFEACVTNVVAGDLTYRGEEVCRTG
ncbi:MAG: Ig-like domain-containing protein, partial [Acidimicrobiia bacterium]|nr:Ig-like domain-containing protein [Acidimicrobiia bacterium]